MPPADHDVLIHELYRGILGREPDPEGLRHYSAALAQGHPPADIMRALLASPEFIERQGLRVPLMPAHYALPMRIEHDLSDSDRDRLWAHIGQIWASQGQNDPFWSVISAPAYRMASITDAAIDTFYRGGAHEVERIDAWLRRSGFELRPDMVCMEFGCGVGRLTGWLARRCKHLHALDISPPHLARTAARVRATATTNVSLTLLGTPAELGALPAIDLFVSFLVLQHNPPPIIALILGRAFQRLTPGGLALFQLPTYHQDYSFVLETYLRGIGHTDIEMHCLPQHDVFQIAAQNGLTPLEIQQDQFTGDWGISHTFLFQKPPKRRGTRTAPR